MLWTFDPTARLYAAAAFFIFALTVVAYYFVDKRLSARRTVAEFVARFPGRCMICSYHGYGVTHGHTDAPTPLHDCIEGNGIR